MADTNDECGEIIDNGIDASLNKEEHDSKTIELSEESRSILSNDYAPLAALLQQFDQQVSSFTQQMEQIAYQAAPDYEGLAERWTQEAAILKSGAEDFHRRETERK